MTSFAQQPDRYLSTGNLVAFLGDSITAQGFGGSEVLGYAYTAAGFATWAAFLGRRRFEIDPIRSNHGVSGNTTAQMLARLPAVIQSRPAVCVVLAGTNDITGSAATTKANLASIYRQLLGAGIAVVAVCITPRGGAITSAQQGIIQQVNQWIREQRYTRGKFYVVDPTLALVNGATGTPATGMTSDDLHPTSLGAYHIGKAVADCLIELFPVPWVPFNNTLDVYHATENPGGNLLTSGLMAGTGGTLSNGPTGSLATGWSANGVNMPAGSTTAFAKVAKSDGRDFQQVTFGGTYNVASPGVLNVTTASVHANVAAGDVLEAVCELEADAGFVNMASAQLVLNTTTPGDDPVPQDMQGNNGHQLPNVAYSGILKTPRVTIPATPSVISVSLRFGAKGVGVSSPLTGVLRWGSVSIRKVQSS